MSRKASTTTSASTATIGFEGKLWLTADSEGEKTHRSVNLLGRVYEYFLTRFASAQGKNGGVAKCEIRSASVEVKTSRPFVIRNSSFEILPDPACGSGGMFVQSEKFVESHGGVFRCGLSFN